MKEEEIAGLQAVAEALVKAHDQKPYMLWKQSVVTTTPCSEMILLKSVVEMWFTQRGLYGTLALDSDYPAIVIQPGLPSTERLNYIRALRI